jgi:glycosyltransferase involved in cell wall biosynthesis
MRQRHTSTEQPRVNIITACRNSVRTIEGSIGSVIDQDYRNVEHIIIDAESTDGTYEIISRFQKKITIWVREPDDGIADAWNKGIKRTTGEIIGILNADDLYTVGTISAVVDTFESNPECGFVFGDLEMRNSATGRSYRVYGRADYQRIIRYNMLGIPHPTVFVKKSVYDQVGLFDTRYVICSDYELIRRMVANGIKGVYLPRILTIMGEGGLSERDRVQAAREVRDISIKYGANRLFAYHYFYLKFLRFYTGKMIDHLGISLSTQRRLFHNRNWHTSD